MIIILPKSKEYQIGNDFPLISIPQEGGNKQKGSFSDFQWWALSKDFQAWLEKNPRQWTAESWNPNEYSLEQLIRERLNPNFSDPIISENSSSSHVLDYKSFSNLNEENQEEGQKAATEEEIGQAVKFHFAYNKLLSEGKLDKDLSAAEISSSGEMAVFLVVENPENGENLTETLKAYKMGPVSKETSATSKIELINVTEMVPGGKISETDAPENVVGRAISAGMALGVAGLAAGALHSVFIVGGGILGGRELLRSIQGYSRTSKTASQVGKAGMLKTIFGKTKNILSGALKTTKQVGAALGRGFSGAQKAFTLGKSGVGGAIKAFGRGASRGLAKVGGKAIPIVGLVLTAVDAIGSIWNWYSTNQAPRYKEVDDFAHNEMDPKKLPIGVPITICWSQEAQSTFGSIMNFLANNDTRTTCELIKVGERGGKSIFILTQINSKSLQEQLMNHDLVLMYLDNSDVVNDQGGFVNTVQRFFDNEDLDFTLEVFDNLEGAASVVNFQGACAWEEFMSAYDSSQDQLIVAKSDAPETYQFHYKDPDGDVINVSGKIVPSEQLKNSDSEKLMAMFFPEQDAKFKTKYTEEEKEEQIEKDILAVSETINDPILKLVSEEGIITSFGDFGKNLQRINETDENEEEEDPIESPGEEDLTEEPEAEESGTREESPESSKIVPVKPNPKEGDDDKDAEDMGAISVQPKDLANPVEVAIYVVTEKNYANPDLRKYALRGSKFTNFLVDDSDLSAKDGEKITVDVNTVGGVNPIDPRRGIFTYVPDEEEETEEDIESRKVEPSAPEEEVEGDEPVVAEPEPIIASPKDVKIRDRKNKIIIRDKSVEDGVNTLEEFLSDEDKKILGIVDWKSITLAKAKKNRSGEIDEVIFRNRYAPFGKKSRKYRITDGQAFEIAKKYVGLVDDRIKYQ